MMNKLNVFTFLIIVYSVVVCMTVKHTDELQVVANHIQKDTVRMQHILFFRLDETLFLQNVHHQNSDVSTGCHANNLL